jgi:hypothetical protein
MDEIRNILIGFAIMMLILSGGLVFLSAIYTTDPTISNADELKTFNSSFNKLEDIDGYSQNIKTNLANKEAESGTLGFFNGLINIVWNVVKSIFTNITFVSDFFYALGTSSYLGIPAWAITVVMSIIFLVIGFAIIKVVFGGSG